VLAFFAGAFFAGALFLAAVAMGCTSLGVSTLTGGALEALIDSSINVAGTAPP